MSLEPSKHSLNFTAAVGEAINPYAALQSVSGEARLQPHQQRVITERDELQARLTALTSFIDSELFDTLPKAEQGRLQRQKLIMIDYVAVLNERVASW